MQKGQWIRIAHMDGEPRYTGAVGQYDHTDDMGQLHGTWGIAINPSTDVYEIIDEDTATAIAEKCRVAHMPVRVGTGSAAAEYEFGYKGKTLPGYVHVTFDTDDRCVLGVAETLANSVYSEAVKVTGVARPCVRISVKPNDIRKPYESYIGAVREALRLAWEACR